jgi:5-bromo-4-chloroindolyl phosphate hydrolysis protein
MLSAFHFNALLRRLNMLRFAIILALFLFLSPVMAVAEDAKEGFKEVHQGMKKVVKEVDKNAKKVFKPVHNQAKKDVKTIDKAAKKGWKQADQDMKKATK